jgi:hypothetical protein
MNLNGTNLETLPQVHGPQRTDRRAERPSAATFAERQLHSAVQVRPVSSLVPRFRPDPGMVARLQGSTQVSNSVRSCWSR